MKGTLQLSEFVEPLPQYALEAVKERLGRRYRPSEASHSVADDVITAPVEKPKSSPTPNSVPAAVPMPALAGVVSAGTASPVVPSAMVTSPEAASPVAASPTVTSPVVTSPVVTSPEAASPVAASLGAASPGAASAVVAPPSKIEPAAVAAARVEIAAPHDIGNPRGPDSPTSELSTASHTPARELVDELARQRPAATRKWALWGCAAAIVAVLVTALAVFGIHKKPLPEAAPAIPDTLGTPETEKPPPAATLPPAVPTPKAGSVIRDCASCALMTVLPTGRYEQGSVSAASGATGTDHPQHSVTIGYPLAMFTNDVTVGEFKEFVAASTRKMQGCDAYDGQWHYHLKNSWKDPGFEQTDTHPVTCVSWDDAVAYAEWLSHKSGHRYRLPTASEWEFAARAGGTAVTPWGPGSVDACLSANVADASAARRYPGWEVFPCDDSHVYTAPVGSYKANAFGLNDMLGNVFVWTEDCWHGNYEGAPNDGSARMDGDCSDHELRGGSWFSSPQYVTASHRNHFAKGYRTSSVGLRLVREVGS